MPGRRVVHFSQSSLGSTSLKSRVLFRYVVTSAISFIEVPWRSPRPHDSIHSEVSDPSSGSTIGAGGAYPERMRLAAGGSMSEEAAVEGASGSEDGSNLVLCRAVACAGGRAGWVAWRAVAAAAAPSSRFESWATR
eukprot:4078544-Prymnesium_polylepis.2